MRTEAVGAVFAGRTRALLIFRGDRPLWPPQILQNALRALAFSARRRPRLILFIFYLSLNYATPPAIPMIPWHAEIFQLTFFSETVPPTRKFH